MHTLFMYCVLLIFNFHVYSNTVTNRGFELQVVHLNDFHARFEETSKASSVCKQDCIGGFSRIYTIIHQIKQDHPDAIVLNAGDSFQGTLWYNLYKWNATQYFLNKLPMDAQTFGNHEFDDGIDGVVPFLDHIKAPTVAVNIDDSREPKIQGKFNKSVIIERNGVKIGIIGVITSTTFQITRAENLIFFDEVESVNQEADRLVAEDNVDTIIVLSHSGYKVEQKIAANARPKIGLVVGGHSHTFLYTGDNPPEGEKPEGPYPTIVKNRMGQNVLVVQAAAFAKFVGNITVQYDSNGTVIKWSGAPIYLDQSIPQDETVLREIAVWKEGVDKYGNAVLGNTKVFLQRINCRVEECNFGNLLADSMIYGHLDTDEEDAWINASIAVINSGGIRSSIEIGNITVADLVAAVPFENTLDIADIQGRYIRDFLEQAADSLGKKYRDFDMLQLSGIRVVYNKTYPIGSRVQSVKVRCRECLVPLYENLDDEKYYRIVVNSFLARGGDGFNSLSDHLINPRIGPRDIDILQKFIAKENPLIRPLDGRIRIVD